MGREDQVSKFNIGDRVRVVKAPLGDEDMIGLEGPVVKSDWAAKALGFDATVALENRPARLSDIYGKVNFFFDQELELVNE